MLAIPKKNICKAYWIFSEKWLFNNILIKSFNFLSNPGNLESELLHNDQDQGLEEQDVGHVLHEGGEHFTDASLVWNSKNFGLKKIEAETTIVQLFHWS